MTCSATGTSTWSTSAIRPTCTRTPPFGLRAGKHVLVEKAVALQRGGSRRHGGSGPAGRAAAPWSRHVLPFVPEFALAAECVRDGRFGKVLGGHFKRVISKPDWSAAIGDAAKTGGPAVDLHVHDTHFIGLLCGVPAHVFAVGTEDQGVVTYLTASYLYGPGGPCVTCSSGALAQKGRPFVHGFEIYLERATLILSPEPCR